MSIFGAVKRAVKTAGKALLSPVIKWLAVAVATVTAGFSGVLKKVVLWTIDLISNLLGSLLDLLGISNLIPSMKFWDDLLNSEFGSNFLFVMNDLGLVDALAVLAAAYTIKLIRMIIPLL